MDDAHFITKCLEQCRKGDQEAERQLMEWAMDELRAIARRQLRSERRDHTLQPTALVNEFYLRFFSAEQYGCKDRLHFYSVAGKIMRQILVDHARARNARRRGGLQAHLPLEESEDLILETQAMTGVDVLALDRALTRLQKVDEGQCRIIELHFFSGLTFPQIAQTLEVTERTIFRKWKAARLWLKKMMGEGVV